MPISEETSAEVIGILAPIWHDKAATAIKVPQRIRAVLEWAVAMDLRPDNPCNRIGPALGAQDKGGAVLRALPHGEVAGAIKAVRESDARPVVKLVFEFLALTATRSGEVRGAVWTDIGRDEAVLAIPPGERRGNRKHGSRCAGASASRRPERGCQDPSRSHARRRGIGTHRRHAEGRRDWTDGPMRASRRRGGCRALSRRVHGHGPRGRWALLRRQASTRDVEHPGLARGGSAPLRPQWASAPVSARRRTAATSGISSPFAPTVARRRAAKG